MIPRAAKRQLRTTLLASRQALPRPARLISTPSKPANSPALAALQVPRNDYQPFQAKDLQAFLSRPTSYTILPTPLPSDSFTYYNSHWYQDTATQDSLAIMDACLQNGFDVARAHNIFERLRAKPYNALDIRMYNAILESHVKESRPDAEDRVLSFYYLWELYTAMEKGQDRIPPSAGTYALMLTAWLRFGPESPEPIPVFEDLPTIKDLLSRIVERKIPISKILADRAFTTSEEAVAVIKLLSKAAVDLNLSHIVHELGQVQSIGSHTSDVIDTIPEVTPVLREKKSEQEGEEPQYEVPFNLDNLRRHLAEVTYARRVLPDDIAARQKLLEESVYDVAVERLKHEADLFASLGLDANTALMRADLKQWMWDWHTKLKTRLVDEIKSITEAEAKKPPKLHSMLSPYLSLVNSERLSLITILEIMRLQGSGGLFDGMKTTRALVSVGKAVEVEYKAQMCRKNNIPIPTSSSKVNGSADLGYFSNMGYKNLQQRRIAAAKHMTDNEGWTAVWSQVVRSKIGGILVDCLMDVATVPRVAQDKNSGEMISEMQPAFYHSYEYQRGQKLGVIRLNPVLMDKLAKDGVRETLHPRHLPMLIKPKPWINYDNGGYLYNKTSAMRFKDSIEQQSYLKQASELGNVELVYAGLDVLGSTPWKINKRVFDVVLEAWNSGERLGKLPPAAYDQPEPEKPEHWDTDMKARSVHIQRQKAYLQAKANNHSDRCNVNYKIEIARAFVGDTVYQPHNLDFRGRAYPIPPHLNHIGDDLSRGLMTFAETKPLGERGLRWLKIHLANLYGFDKANFDERVEFTEKHLDVIFDSATNPLGGSRWWTKADDPWQCLATCFELHAALTSPVPVEYESALPVHQDGTCNGLQHYAALGGDDRGARQVNLHAGDRPSDVYTYVGNMVQQKLEEDVTKGEKYAAMLQGKITRKVVKQTVMTTVYGVTFIGAREQIEKQLRDRKDIPEEECWGAASYLAKRTLECIGDLFSGASAIQIWLSLCARLIAKSIPEERIPEAMSEIQLKPLGRRRTTIPKLRLKKEQMTSVIWTTPLGLPIVQPYRKPSRKQIMTNVQTVYISDPNAPAEVNSQKQASAFPPNFVHSLDATHMMLTALECKTQGLTFASVHDSYWTHACDIDKMSEVIRDTFIALHSSDILSKLREEFMERYEGYKIPLISLRSGQLLQRLKAAGARIVCTPEQARTLESISPLLEVSETGDSTVDVHGNTVSLSQSDSSASTKSSSSIAQAQEDEDEEFDEDEEDSPWSKARRKREADNEKADQELYGKFIDLTDILPPLPKKGNFKVENIKKSQYFFS